jgi:hypothetical protein
MKNMMLAAALLPMLVLPVSAQDAAWSDLALGDRVEVTFPSGATLMGTLVAPRPKVETVDYAREAALTLDVTWEYPGLNGTMTVPKKDVKGVRKLRVLDEKSRQRIADMKAAIKADHEAVIGPKPPVAVPVPEAPVADPAPEDPAAKAAAELKKAMDFFAKYAPPDWGPERRIMINQKRARGQALSLAEGDFDQGYELWEKGRAAAAKKPAEPRKD